MIFLVHLCLLTPQTQQPTRPFILWKSVENGDQKPKSMKTRLFSTPIFTLSLISLITACFGGIGIIFSVTAYIKAHQKIKQAQQNPLGFTGSLNTMKLGKTAAIVASTVNLIYFGYTAVWIYQNGFQAFQDRWLNMLFLR